MTATRSTGPRRRAGACTAYLRAACARSVRWFDAPRLVRTRRRRRTALAAAAIAAGTAIQTTVPVMTRLAGDAAVGAAVLREVPAGAPFALVLHTTIPFPVLGARLSLRLTVAEAAGWQATLALHAQPAGAIGIAR